MVLFLLLSGICWSIVYIELIYVGFKNETYGMPFIALALNFSWEVLYCYLGFTYTPENIQNYITLIWLILDTAVVLTYLIYGKKYFPKYTSKKYFVPWTILIFFMSFVLQYYFVVEFKDLGKLYSAFLQNLVMSILFIHMLITRTDTKGQNLTIAINKWIGTLSPTILYGIIVGNKLILALGIFCSIFDILYIYFLSTTRKLHNQS